MALLKNPSLAIGNVGILTSDQWPKALTNFHPLTSICLLFE